MKKKNASFLFPLSLLFFLVPFVLFIIKKKTEKEIFRGLEDFDFIK